MSDGEPTVLAAFIQSVRRTNSRCPLRFDKSICPISSDAAVVAYGACAFITMADE